MDDDLAEAFKLFQDAKRDADTANRKLEVREMILLKLMEARRRKTIEVWDGKVKCTATYTRRNTMKINEIGLRKALTARVFDRYTVKKLDRHALEQAMGDGKVDPVVVARFVETEPGKTYVTYRVKDEDGQATDL